MALVSGDVSRSYELARGPRSDRGIVAVLCRFTWRSSQTPRSMHNHLLTCNAELGSMLPPSSERHGIECFQ